MHIKKSDPSVKKILQSTPLCYNKPYNKKSGSLIKKERKLPCIFLRSQYPEALKGELYASK